MRAPRIAVALLLGLSACARKPAAKAAATTHPSQRPSYEIRLGRTTYMHYCQSCHGDTGAGDGFNAFNLDPHPRDLSDPAFQNKKTDADLADVITRGGAGVGLSSLMPPWGRTLSREEIDQAIQYVRTLRKH